MSPRTGFVVGFDEGERLTLARWLREGGRPRSGLVERVADRAGSRFAPDPRLVELEAVYRAYVVDLGLADGDLTRAALNTFAAGWRAAQPPLSSRELRELAFPDD